MSVSLYKVEFTESALFSSVNICTVYITRLDTSRLASYQELFSSDVSNVYIYIVCRVQH